MDSHKADRASCKKAWIAIVTALSCFLFYVLACVVSTPSWSPDCTKIAILVTPPGNEPDKFAIFTYDIATGERVLLDEVKADGLLSTPAWSPDGTWIAYYRVEPNAPAEIPPSDPNSALPRKQQASTKIGDDAGQSGSPEAGRLLSEENKMLPSVMFEFIEEFVKEKKETDLFDMKLMLIRPDGSGKKTLHTAAWVGKRGDEATLAFIIRPVWSKDCKRLFYVRGFEEHTYVGSIDISTGKTYAHLLTSAGISAVSPDGKWIASFLEDGTLVTARVDGSMCKYFRLDVEVEDDYLFFCGGGGLFWSLDSQHVFVVGKESTMHAVDIASGQTEQYADPDANNTAYYTVSSGGDKLYYLAGSEANEDGSPQGVLSLRYMNLRDRHTGTVFVLPQIPELSGGGDGGIFSISPNGKIVLLRTSIQDEHDITKSVLIFCDGKTQKTVETDRWLLKPLYSDSDLIFEEKLIGKWRGTDGEMFVAERGQGRTYKFTMIEEDQEHHSVANLVRLRDTMFMGVFFDESLLLEKDSSGSHLLPDIFIKIDQIEPKLLLQTMEYDEVARMQEKENGLPAQGPLEADYTFEGVRVQP